MKPGALNNGLGQNCVIGVVIHRSPLNDISIAAAAEWEIKLLQHLGGNIGAQNIPPHRKIARGLQQGMQLVGADALNGLSEQTAADSAHPGALDFTLQLLWVESN